MKIGYVWIPLLAAGYAFLVWSPLGSIFAYNGPLVAVLAVQRYQGRRNYNTTRKLSREHSGLNLSFHPGGVNH
jgi:hypothetical protein